MRLVDRVIEKKRSKVDSSEEEREIDEIVYKLYDLTKNEIDKIVYGLHGLSEGEIKMVEGNN